MNNTAAVATPGLHICIATGQNLANLIPALQCKANEVWILQTPQMRASAGHLADALKARSISVQPIDFADDDVTTQHAQAAGIAELLDGRAVTINLTGGTKLMTLALTETLAAHLSTNNAAAQPHLVYTDTKNHRLDWLRPEPRSEVMISVLNINDTLLVQGYRQVDATGGADAAWRQRDASQRSELTKYLGHEAQELDELLSRLNGLAQAALNGRGPLLPKQNVSLPANPRRAQKLRDVLARAAGSGGLLDWDGRGAVTFHDEAAARYIGGGWVEEFAASKMRGYVQCDCASQLRVRSMRIDDASDDSTNELDAVMVHGNRMLVVECKAAVTTNDDKLADWIYKISQVARSVGGQMAQPLLLSAREIGDKPRRRALDYGVAVLAAGELTSFPDYLRRWMAG